MRLSILFLVILVYSNSVHANLGSDVAINYDGLYFHSYQELQQFYTGLGFVTDLVVSGPVTSYFGLGTDNPYGSLGLIHDKSTVLTLQGCSVFLLFWFCFSKTETIILENFIFKKEKFISKSIQ